MVLERTGRRADALAALERAVTLEPDNSRHQVRLALGGWGETRLRAARRALAQCPQLPLAHWLAATMFVARGALDQAERDVDRTLAVAAVESPEAAPYSMVALHWLKGLLPNASGASADAMAWFDRELALEARGHLYAREPGANTGYAKGACHLDAGQRGSYWFESQPPSHSLISGQFWVSRPARRVPPNRGAPSDPAGPQCGCYSLQGRRQFNAILDCGRAPRSPRRRRRSPRRLPAGGLSQSAAQSTSRPRVHPVPPRPQSPSDRPCSAFQQWGARVR